MYLLIDGQALQTHSRTRGIGRYSRNLIAGLRAVRPRWRVEIVQSSHLPPIDTAAVSGCITRPFVLPFPHDVAHAEANERYYGDWLTDQDADAVLVLNFMEGDACVPTFTGPRPPLYGILYDLIPLLFPQEYLGRSLPDHLMYAARLRQMLAANALLAISEASARDFRKLVAAPRPEVHAIGGAADQSFAPHTAEQLEKHRARLQHRFGLRRDFVLYVGGPDYRKNLYGALEAFAALPTERRRHLDLVVSCFLLPDQYGQLRDRARTLGIDRVLKLTGYISDDELRALYQMCRVFFFPSLYEGLGLPVLEAMMCGAPVAAANTSSVPEFTGPAAWLADPASSADMARALEGALVEPRGDRQAERVAHARSFTWERTAELACDVLASPCPESTAPKPRIAWVSPLAPMPCALAHYSSELLEQLADRFDIELITGPSQPALPPEAARRHIRIEATELAARHGAEPYDLFVYHLGNTPHCLFQLELLSRYPGMIFLHDYHLGDLVGSACRAWRWPVSLPEELEAEGHVELARRVRDGSLDATEAVRCAPLNQRILSAAEVVAVGSTWAWQQLRARLPVPVVRVPLAVQVPELASREEMRRDLGLSPGSFVIATPGFEDSCRALPRLFRSIQALPAALREQTRVLLLGPLSARQHHEVGVCVREAGMERNVISTPALSMGELAAHARAADVWVQLAAPRADEAAGHLFRAMGTGTPCVIADEERLADLPAEAAWKVRISETATDDLTAALAELAADSRLRQERGDAGAKFVAARARAEQPAQLAALIEMSIQRRKAHDARWAQHAWQALADCADPTTVQAHIDHWAALRARGQERLRDRPLTAGESTDLPSARPQLLRA